MTLHARAFINRIATAVPPHEMHEKFSAYGPALLSSARDQALFRRVAQRSGIERRHSFLAPDSRPEALDTEGFYRPGHFPDTKTRMRRYERDAPTLAIEACDRLGLAMLAPRVTHLILTSCTGFYAPGLDIQMVQHYGLRPSVERSILGFMGCYAAINALKLARHIVRSDPDAGVVVLNLELCTLHLTDADDLETVLSYLIFADGAAASFISAEASGIELQSFHSTILTESADHIRWHIGHAGFEMMLSGRVPGTIAQQLPGQIGHITGGLGASSIAHWAVHPGGRSVLDAVEQSLHLPPTALEHSRAVLRDYGNMSSPTILFVLKRFLESDAVGQGCALAFGPGLTSESLLFGLHGAAA